MKIVITIPAYNEAKTISKVISSINEFIDNHKDHEYKLLVVDDGSKDGTAKVSKSLGAIVYSHPKNYGLAETFRTEVKKCLELGADVIVHIDADGQYIPKEISKLVKGVEDGYDLVLGSRFSGKIEYMPLLKKMGNIAFSKVISNVTGVKITDGQTGFRAFTSEVAKTIDLRSNHTYTQEQIIRAVMHKFKILEVPVYFAKRKDKSRLISHPLEYAARAWVNIIRTYRDYEPLKFFGKIGLMFIVPGFLIGIWLVSLLLTTGKVGHTGSAILSVLLIMIGIQFISFGLLADMRRVE